MYPECFYPHTPEKKSDPIQKRSSTVTSTPERNHSKVWEEDIKLPERRQKEILNPWE